MIYFGIIIFLILIIYIYFFYKTKGFILMSKNGLASLFLILSLILSLISFFSYYINDSQKIKTETSDIVFVLDVSKSMLAIDYAEKSRLQISKEFIKDYVTKNDKNRYSLTIFSGDAVSLIPLTQDKNIFLTFLDSIDEKSILKGGTNFKEALNISNQRFEKNGGAIIFISDFEPNLNISEKQKLLQEVSAQQKNVKIFGVGLGTEVGNKIINGYDFFGGAIYLKDNFGKDVITKFDKEFFDGFLDKLNAGKFVIKKEDDIKKIEFLDIPSNMQEIEMTIKKDFSRYLMIFSFISFLFYLILFYYFDKKGK